ncbi:centrosomal protein of 290 kDa [Aplysia californica]|uniref:Centrosomal protein of 290 kDa n=1 Tax=Aplysia californica TaxID=6500 RepID=A0ABM0JGL0_APLCA|nr:centrosomal protein of 290 kDa [Aplysia californica]
MNLHDIHSCSKAAAENVELRRKLALLKRKYDELQHQIKALVQEKTSESAKSCQRTFQNSCVQTDSKPWMFRHGQGLTVQQERKVSDSDIAKTNKVLEMHAQLLKRYDKEVKLNMTYADSISELNIRLAETEKSLREEKEKSTQLERELFAAKRSLGEKLKGKGRVEDPVLRDVVEERNKLLKENKRLRGELKGFDHNFFDEIEDLKFALLQSAKLNSSYEKSLRDLCSKFGVPCPVKETRQKKR